ncbi:Hypothetical predicted protein [Lecanosticta acicola]|uniref:Uncharacterized protein n=1 Tax=Lecanosticta acicola TaxID=111012 RepID=A0AAI8YVT4_9PEZI|nr:Hypothetical predicted protein [Lecanosticta acicola]
MASQDTTTAASTSKKTTFLDLSAELRNKIYEDALVQPKGIKFRYDLSLLTQPALTRTCRQIRHESLPIFYGQNFITSFSLICLMDAVSVVPQDQLEKFQCFVQSYSCCFSLDSAEYSLSEIHKNLRGTGLVARVKICVSLTDYEECVWASAEDLKEYREISNEAGRMWVSRREDL